MKINVGGQEIDLVTPAELRQILGESFPARRGPQWERSQQGIVLDASGNGSVKVYKVPNGMRFRLHRLRVSVDTYTPAAPYTNAAGYGEITSENDGVEFVSFSPTAGGLPATWSDSVGLLFHALEVVGFTIVAGPAGGSVMCRAQGVLEPQTID